MSGLGNGRCVTMAGSTGELGSTVERGGVLAGRILRPARELGGRRGPAPEKITPAPHTSSEDLDCSDIATLAEAVAVLDRDLSDTHGLDQSEGGPSLLRVRQRQ